MPSTWWSNRVSSSICNFQTKTYITYKTSRLWPLPTMSKCTTTSYFSAYWSAIPSRSQSYEGNTASPINRSYLLLYQRDLRLKVCVVCAPLYVVVVDCMIWLYSVLNSYDVKQAIKDLERRKIDTNPWSCPLCQYLIKCWKHQTRLNMDNLM